MSPIIDFNGITEDDYLQRLIKAYDVAEVKGFTKDDLSTLMDWVMANYLGKRLFECAMAGELDVLVDGKAIDFLETERTSAGTRLVLQDYRSVV